MDKMSKLRHMERNNQCCMNCKHINPGLIVCRKALETKKKYNGVTGKVEHTMSDLLHCSCNVVVGGYLCEWEEDPIFKGEICDEC